VGDKSSTNLAVNTTTPGYHLTEWCCTLCTASLFVDSHVELLRSLDVH